ncbi:RNA polymerase II transcriptional coactivator KIWI-like [Mangifera indica]|uniref:RNA polymerase II transcriptional coactivator KIWI-like n=1 Tax=Mangifera indica TaxID=29780 RepID=UPI001CFAA71C|nr:RNA polymerase II transcriptional coactivator KIWI-like [Mangifera indica]
MSGRWKRKEEEYESDGSGDSHARPNKVSKADSDDIVVCEISKNRRVSVRNWQGKIWIDIREFFVKDGKKLPGKKGILLSVDQWNILRDHVEDIDRALGES